MSNPIDDIMIREPMFEDLFYPGDKNELSCLIRTLLASAERKRASRLALSPCASMDFAGDLIAKAVASFEGTEPERIIIIASAEPDWDQSGPALWLPESSSFRTPLYESMVDMEYCATLRDMSTLFRVNDLPHLETFRIEVQLPFIHVLFPQASIVPVLMSGRSEGLVKALTGGIHMSTMEHPAREAILVCGNISGYRPYAESRVEADTIIDLIRQGNYQALLQNHTLRTDSINVLAFFAAMLKQKPIEVLGQKSSTMANKTLVSFSESIEYAALADC